MACEVTLNIRHNQQNKAASGQSLVYFQGSKCSKFAPPDMPLYPPSEIRPYVHKYLGTFSYIKDPLSPNLLREALQGLGSERDLQTLMGILI